MRLGDGHAGRTLPAVDDVDTVPAPVVFCPFPPRISPHVARLERYAVAWATRHGFLGDQWTRAAFARARFASLMARAYPEADQTDLRLTVSWLTFTFMLDDHLETALGCSPQRQRELADQVVAYLVGDGPSPTALGRPLAGALDDVWTRTRARTGVAWRARFVRNVAEYLAANAWEADNRSRRRIPPVGEYLRMRRHSAACAMFFDLVEALAGADADTEPFTEAGLALLRLHAANVVAWFNDLVSWRKEAADGDPHNLVLVVRHGLRLSLADAVRHVVARHDQEVRAFLAARDRFWPQLSARPEIRRAVEGLECWIRANVDWSRESGRYAAPAYFDPRA